MWQLFGIVDGAETAENLALHPLRRVKFDEKIMKKRNKKYNPRKLIDKPQTFIYEIRVWSESTDQGPIEQSHAFAFPVENTRIKADKYAFDFGIVAWAFIGNGISDLPEIDNLEKLHAILDDDGIAALTELRSKLVGPCYGKLVRHPTTISFGAEMAEYGTVNDGRFRITDVLSAADNTIGRLAS